MSGKPNEEKAVEKTSERVPFGTQLYKHGLHAVKQFLRQQIPDGAVNDHGVDRFTHTNVLLTTALGCVKEQQVADAACDPTKAYKHMVGMAQASALNAAAGPTIDIVVDMDNALNGECGDMFAATDVTAALLRGLLDHEALQCLLIDVDHDDDRRLSRREALRVRDADAEALEKTAIELLGPHAVVGSYTQGMVPLDLPPAKEEYDVTQVQAMRDALAKLYDMTRALAGTVRKIITPAHNAAGAAVGGFGTALILLDTTVLLEEY
jgi:hypothetical protein